MNELKISSIAELYDLINKSSLSIKSIQEELNCDDFTAQHINALLKLFDFYCNSNEANSPKLHDFFRLSKNEQASFFTHLVFRYLEDSGLNLINIYPQIRKELTRIIELDMIADFILAYSVAGILNDLDCHSHLFENSQSHFFGIGCSSTIAYALGISGFSLNPLEHGLIFERAFPIGVKQHRVFNFYVKEDNITYVVAELKEIFGECKLIEIDSTDRVLQVNDVQIYISNSLGDFEDQYYNFDETIRQSTIAVFQEDYMHMLHIVGGFSYDQANEVRKDIFKCKTQKIEEYKNIFMSNSAFLAPHESKKLFDDIANGIKNAYSKAWYLSTKEIFDDFLPF